MKISRISAFHYFRLIYRGAIFIWALLTLILSKPFHVLSFGEAIDTYRWLFIVIWVVLAIEMILRFFPSSTESMGCQKQFKKNFIPVEGATPDTKKANHGVLTALASWIALNGFIAVLHSTGIIQDGILLLVALFYSVSDMICILFFCPFQTWMMKNRCCTTCRIYNWDYAMICTPLLLIWHPYTLSLSALSLILLFRWELTAYLHPERFSQASNRGLACKNCQEKLCRHKKQLHTLWRKEGIRIVEDAARLAEDTVKKVTGK